MDSHQPSLGYLVNNDQDFARKGNNFMKYKPYEVNQNGPNNSNFSTIKGAKFTSKIYSEEVAEEGSTTLKKFVFTPPKKENNPNESKQTLNGLGLNFHKGHWEKDKKVEVEKNFNSNVISENKENSFLSSNMSSNSFNSSNNFNSSQTSSHGESAFKMPARKPNLPYKEEALNPFLQSVKVNLNQEAFGKKEANNIGNNLFGMRSEKFVNKTIISSSSSSNNTNNSQSNYSPFIPTQQTITESFLDGFSNKSNVNNVNNDNKTETISMTNSQVLKSNFVINPNKLDEEKYKLLQIKKVRKETFKDNKSASKVNMDIEYEDLITQNQFNQKRKKMVHSVKRVYASEIVFTDSLTNEKKAFRIYKDSETGINEYWQQFIKESQGDEDVPSDEELIQKATKHNLDNLLLEMERLRNRKKGDPELLENSRLLNEKK